MELIGRIYCLFESLFGQQLGEYMWGYNCETTDFTDPYLFPRIALWTFLISISVVLLYYYGINHPRFKRWWHWMIMLVGNAFVCFIFGYWWIREDYDNSLIGDCLLYGRDETGDIIAYYITDSNFWGFAITNAIISVLLFFILSFMLKWWSSTCKSTPF